MLNEELVNKWKMVLEHEDLPRIESKVRRDTTARLIENTVTSMQREPGEWAQSSLTEAAPTNNISAGNIAGYDPIMISLLRRTMPNLMAYDIAGVQPMTGPTGLIFAMRSTYTNQSGTETFYNEVNTAFSSLTSGTNTVPGQANLNLGGNSSVVVSGNSETYNYATGMTTAYQESLGSSGANAFAEMAFTIEKVTATAVGRALKAEYTMELAQDLKQLHGLDAETELANILTGEMLAEINRELVRTINVSAVTGAALGTTTAGTFDLDTDSNGRWFGEKFKGLMFQIELEANALARTTRRGKGNIVICSSDVASALNMAGFLTYTPALNSNNLNVDDTGNTFAGILNNRMKVYVDPYAGGRYMTVGYRGSNPWDAGVFYCPYVPLQMVRAVGENSFQPKIGFKTRYAMVANPYSPGATASNGAIVANTNVYYRRILIQNLF